MIVTCQNSIGICVIHLMTIVIIEPTHRVLAVSINPLQISEQACPVTVHTEEVKAVWHRKVKGPLKDTD